MMLKRLLLFALLGLFPQSVFAADEAFVTIFLAKQVDVCPGGYSQPKCRQFTAARFEELKAKKLLQRLGNSKPIQFGKDPNKPTSVLLEDELGLIRRLHATGSTTTALIVVEWKKAETPPNSMSLSFQPAEMTDDDIVTGALENRRAFSHANVRNLDPEERYVWSMSRGGKIFSLIFE